MAEKERSHLIEMLLEQGVVSDVQLNRAKAGIHTSCEAYSLISAGFISEINLAAFAAKNIRVPFIELSVCEIEPDVLRLVPEEYCALNCCLPVFRTDNSVTAAMVDPLDGGVVRELAEMVCADIRPVLCSLRDFLDKMKSVWIELRDAEKDGEKNPEGTAAQL